MLAVLAAASAFAVVGADVQHDLERCGVNEAAFERLLNLPERAFDQDFSSGWRAIDTQPGCHRAAGEMLQAYILYAKPVPPKAVATLRWHAGQVFASDGDYARALAFFHGTCEPADPEGQTSVWNLYVKGTIASLEGSRPDLDAATEALAARRVTKAEIVARKRFLAANPNISMPPGFLTEPQNLAVLRGLQRCWGKSYKEAYGASCNRP